MLIKCESTYLVKETLYSASAIRAREIHNRTNTISVESLGVVNWSVSENVFGFYADSLLYQVLSRALAIADHSLKYKKLLAPKQTLF